MTIDEAIKHCYEVAAGALYKSTENQKPWSKQKTVGSL